MPSGIPERLNFSELECVTIQLEKYYGKRTVYFQDVDNESLNTVQKITKTGCLLKSTK